MEDRFNKKFKYPYVFLNEQPFDENFKKWVLYKSFGTMINRCACRRVAALTDATVQFGLVPADHWTQPQWINETKASAARESMAKNGVIYGGVSSPHH